jgi:hypothetical protein
MCSMLEHTGYSASLVHVLPWNSTFKLNMLIATLGSTCSPFAYGAFSEPLP